MPGLYKVLKQNKKPELKKISLSAWGGGGGGVELNRKSKIKVVAK